MEHKVAYQTEKSPLNTWNEHHFLNVYKKGSTEPDIGELMVPVSDFLKMIKKLRASTGKTQTPIIVLNVKMDHSQHISPGNTLVQRIHDIFCRNISDSSFGMNQLSGELHMSRAQVYRKVQEFTGLTPGRLLRKIRIEKAASLFEQGYRNISQVMYEVGFNNQSYFAKCFRDAFLLNPSEYISNRSAS
jgi:AraC-like DNA-binding protein